ncbi:MAG: hypothetical protein ACYCSJ_01380 [Acidimicrobiales bacterium]
MTTELVARKLPNGRRDGRHWLAPARQTWTPAVTGFFDTETVPEMVGDTEVQRLRLWVASIVTRRHKTPSRVGVRSARGHTGAELADWLTAECGRHESVWLWAHNLGFDLTTTRLLDRLAELGWTLTSVAMTGKSAVVRMRRGKTALCLLDSFSWLQAPLAEIGTMVNVVKPDLPAWGDGDEAWWRRCEADVEILAAAVLELLGWWDEQHLGHFSVTGAGCGFSTIRSHLRPYTVMADPTPEVRRFERGAIFGGRRDLTTWGPCDTGPWVLLDFENAYPTMAGHLALPTIPRGWAEDVAAPVLADPPPNVGYMADVTVRTAQPRYPARVGPDVVFPVGTFTTTLAGPELTLAARRGDLLEVRRARAWHTAPVLTAWSQWILSVLHDPEAGAPGVARKAAKGWSRSGLGKFAGRTSESADRGPAWAEGWTAVRGWDTERAAPALLLELAGRRMWMVRNQETMTAVPAVFAWIESAVRHRLRAVLEELGEDTWVQSDTDGLLASVPALRRWLRSRGVPTGDLRSAMAVAGAVCDLLAVLCDPLVLRPKELYHHLETVGPQHLALGSGRKSSGIRKDATQVGPGVFEGRTWPGLLWQMEHGSRQGYVRPKAVWHLPAVTGHRWALQDGRMAPLEAGLCLAGGWEVVRWPETDLAASGAVLAAHQWARLDGWR